MANTGQKNKHRMETFMETFFDSGPATIALGLVAGVIAILLIGAVWLSFVNRDDGIGLEIAGKYVVIWVVAMITALVYFFYEQEKFAEERAKGRELEYMGGLAAKAFVVKGHGFGDGEYSYKTGAGTFSAKSPAGPGPGDTIRVLFEDKTPVYIALDDTVRITGYQVNEGGR